MRLTCARACARACDYPSWGAAGKAPWPGVAAAASWGCCTREELLHFGPTSLTGPVRRNSQAYVQNSPARARSALPFTRTDAPKVPSRPAVRCFFFLFLLVGVLLALNTSDKKWRHHAKVLGRLASGWLVKEKRVPIGRHLHPLKKFGGPTHFFFFFFHGWISFVCVCAGESSQSMYLIGKKKVRLYKIFRFNNRLKMRDAVMKWWQTIKKKVCSYVMIFFHYLQLKL